MNVKALLLPALLLGACAVDEPRAHVRIVSYAPEPTIVDGANAAWLRLGIVAAGYLPDEVDYSEPECAHVADSECVITIGAYREAHLVERYGAVGLASRAQRWIVIDARFTSYYDVLPIAAHETGHILLDAGHLPDDQRGVMQVGGGGWSATHDDFAHACASLGVCVEW